MDRWVQRNKKDVEAGSTTASHLAVQYPADLAWFDVTCHVLDQKTLKQKQVCSHTVTCSLTSSTPCFTQQPTAAATSEMSILGHFHMH